MTPHLGLCKLNHPHGPGGGPEQEVYLNKKKKVVNTSIYPDDVIERLARCFYPAILECFNSEEGQRAFAAWQAEQARPTVKEKQDVPAGERPALHSNCQRLFSDEARPAGRAFLFCRPAGFNRNIQRHKVTGFCSSSGSLCCFDFLLALNRQSMSDPAADH